MSWHQVASQVLLTIKCQKPMQRLLQHSRPEHLAAHSGVLLLCTERQHRGKPVAATVRQARQGL